MAPPPPTLTRSDFQPESSFAGYALAHLVPRFATSSLSGQISTPSSTTGTIFYPEYASSSTSNLNTTTTIILCVVIAVAVLMHSLLSTRSTLRGKTHEMAEIEASALIGRARGQRHAFPKTAQSIEREMDYLKQALVIYHALPQTQKILNRIFKILSSLVENRLDLLMVSHLPQSRVDDVRALCDELVAISRKIDPPLRPSARLVAYFYKGQDLLVRARLLDRNEGNQTTAIVVDLFGEAFKSFYAAKQISQSFEVTRDRQIQIYLSSSVLSCAFIVSKFPRFVCLEGSLATDLEYRGYKNVLGSQLNNELLEKEVLRLDDCFYMES